MRFLVTMRGRNELTMLTAYGQPAAFSLATAEQIARDSMRDQPGRWTGYILHRCA